MDSAAVDVAIFDGSVSTVEVVAPVLETDSISDASAGPETVGEPAGRNQAAASRSATMTAPFGRADFYGGVGVVRDGVWASLGPNDVPGPLWDAPVNPRAKTAGRVYDVCVLEEAWIISYGYEPGSGVLANFAGPWRRDHRECSTVDDPDHEPFPRWAYVGEVRSSPYFRTKAEAFAWGQEFEDQIRQLISGPLPLYAQPLGMVAESWYEPIEFGSVLDSAEPVRVVPESLVYQAGTLRGLVRNWSPTRFAYNLRASLSGSSWRWPLSVQPGELAPFELTGLAFDETPAAEDIIVEAELRDDADLSRAFDYWCSPHWFEGNAHDLSGRVPDIVYMTLPQDGRHAMAYYCAELDRHAASHPDWKYDKEPVVIDDLRSYVAFLDYSGQVIEIRQLVTFTEYYVDDEDGNSRIRTELINSVPYENAHGWTQSGPPHAWVAFAAPDVGDSDDGFIHSAQWVLWLGGAHPDVQP